MIEEDYVSFETAKLLKEKGFDEMCFHYWHEKDNELVHSKSPHPIRNITNPCFFGPAAPTLQMAMKWLREVHGVFISICNGNHKADNRDTSTPDDVYCFFVITDTRALYEEEKQCLKEFSSYEEACEAAIKYCLENLI